MADQITPEEFVQKCLSWINTGKPLPPEFGFDALYQQDRYKEALLQQSAWVNYWDEFKLNANRRLRQSQRDAPSE